uniref:Uncharacterized protein n=1 Tax=Arundo donax TaxID=35708 RepID=A0A0A9CPK1_ARUDO
MRSSATAASSRPSTVGARPRLRKNEGKRSLRLVESSNPAYMRQCEEAIFGDFDDWEDEEEDEM